MLRFRFDISITYADAAALRRWRHYFAMPLTCLMLMAMISVDADIIAA